MRAHVGERLGVAASDVDILHLGLGRPLHCPADASLRVESLPAERFLGRADLRVMASAGGQPCDDLRLSIRLDVWEEAPVAVRAADAGERVELGRGRVRRTDVSGVPVDPDQGPYEARVPLAPGDAVTLQRVRRMPDGRSGGVVTVLAERGPVRLEARGRLMADASQGDTVQVLNTATGVVLRGTLVQPGLVRVGAGFSGGDAP